MVVGENTSKPGIKADHLFVSYASEDGQFAKWLTLKLTVEGYKVWCDRVKLLGGESYPRDIDKAIKEQTFRVLALLSHDSIDKPNPRKERTLAHNISRERELDFIIPIKVDRIGPTELDWMTSDLTYIDFSDNWAAGFARLLEKLESLGAPRPLADGKTKVTNWVSSMSVASDRVETLWANALEVEEIPQTLFRVEFVPGEKLDWPEDWVFYKESLQVFWSFTRPDFLPEGSKTKITAFDFKLSPGDQRDTFSYIVSMLLGRHVQLFCLKKGMKQSLNKRYLYFPFGLLEQGRLRFQSYSGRATYVNAVGQRTFRLSDGRREISTYHLSPIFRPNLLRFDQPLIEVQMRLFLTDSNGAALEERQIVSRRKKICKTWWNHQWLLRLIGVASWMADGQDSLDLATNQSYRIIVSGLPMRLTVPVGIDESLLGEPSTDDETELIDEYDSGAVDDGDKDDDF